MTTERLADKLISRIVCVPPILVFVLALFTATVPAAYAIEESDFDEEVFNECVLERIR